MSRRRHDLAGQTFGLLLALEDGARDRNGERRYRCRCTCGTERLVRISFLRNGTTKSCGAPGCRRQILPKRKPRQSAAARERDRAIAALVAAGGYGGANDLRNWREHRDPRNGVGGSPKVSIRLVRSAGRAVGQGGDRTIGQPVARVGG